MAGKRKTPQFRGRSGEKVEDKSIRGGLRGTGKVPSDLGSGAAAKSARKARSRADKIERARRFAAQTTDSNN